MLKLRQALCCAEIFLPAGKLRGGSESWSPHRWVAAARPLPGASPAFVGIAAPCSGGLLCLLAPALLPHGGNSLSPTIARVPSHRAF